MKSENEIRRAIDKFSLTYTGAIESNETDHPSCHKLMGIIAALEWTLGLNGNLDLLLDELKILDSAN